jgi:hypothetical protein
MALMLRESNYGIARVHIEFTPGIEAGTRLIHDLEREYQSNRMTGRIGAIGQA